MKDNRNYTYSSDSVSIREEYKYILDWVKPGSSVIDLGCGDGSLLLLLKDKNNIKVADGIEIAKSGVVAAQQKGLHVWQGKIDVHLNDIEDKKYDYAICNVTLQMVMYPEVLLMEMKRISCKQIISFPNFAYIVNRLELLFKAKMPQSMMPGYSWYSTGHIHQLSILDFIDFCDDNQIEIIDQGHIQQKRFYLLPKWLLSLFPNLFTRTALFLTCGK